MMVAKYLFSVLACLGTEALAASPLLSGLQDAVQGALKDEHVKHVMYEQLPKELLQAAGFPTEKELVCKALNNTQLENDFKTLVCELLPKEVGGVKTAEACQSAVAFAWKQERAEEKCPGAPQPWWPFHVLHEVANKLICYELSKHKGVKSINDKEKEINEKVCKALAHNAIDHWACEEAMREVWGSYEKDCKSEFNPAPADGYSNGDLPELNAPEDIGDINV